MESGGNLKFADSRKIRGKFQYEYGCKFPNYHGGSGDKIPAGTAFGRASPRPEGARAAAPLLAVLRVGKKGECRLALYHPKGKFGW